MATTADNSLDLNAIIWSKDRDKNMVLHGLFEEALSERSHQAHNEDTLVGRVVNIGWADGYAKYIVVKARPMTLMHVYLGDGWQVPFYMIRGLRKQEIEAMSDRPDDGTGDWPFYGDDKPTDDDKQFVADALHRLLPKLF